MKNPRHGFLYYAVGEAYITQAVRSISSVKTYMPDIPITVFTNDGAQFSHIATDIRSVPATYSKPLRIQLLTETPYDKTFFIDSDTLFLGACSDLFSLLDTEVLRLCPTLHQPDDSATHSKQTMYNSGVIGYRLTSDVRNLFTVWNDVMLANIQNDTQSKDEPALVQALLRCPIKILPLPAIYNYRHGKNTDEPVPSDVKILHGTDLVTDFMRS